MVRRKKSESVLFSDKIGLFFLVGATRALIIMLVSLITMWLVSIFTVPINMSIMIIVSSGIGVSFGAIRIFDMTLEELSKE